MKESGHLEHGASLMMVRGRIELFTTATMAACTVKLNYVRLKVFANIVLPPHGGSGFRVSSGMAVVCGCGCVFGGPARLLSLRSELLVTTRYLECLVAPWWLERVGDGWC